MIDYRSTRTYNPHGQGLYVAAVAHSNDFQVGDRIVAVNGAGVATSAQMREIIGACHVGDEIAVTVLRGGEQFDVGVTLTESDVPAAAEHVA